MAYHVTRRAHGEYAPPTPLISLYARENIQNTQAHMLSGKYPFPKTHSHHANKHTDKRLSISERYSWREGYGLKVNFLLFCRNLIPRGFLIHYLGAFSFTLLFFFSLCQYYSNSSLSVILNQYHNSYTKCHELSWNLK